MLDAKDAIVGGIPVAEYDTKLVTNETTWSKLVTIVNDAIQSAIQRQIDKSNLVVVETPKKP